MAAFEVERVGGELKRFGVEQSDAHFQVVSPYEPAGDQIDSLKASSGAIVIRFYWV